MQQPRTLWLILPGRLPALMARCLEPPAGQAHLKPLEKLQDSSPSKLAKRVWTLACTSLIRINATYGASQVRPVVKNPPANAGDARDSFDSWVGKIPLEENLATPPVFLPGESHRQRGLSGYSPWGHTESEMPEMTYHARGCSGSGVAGPLSCSEMALASAASYSHIHLRAQGRPSCPWSSHLVL